MQTSSTPTRLFLLDYAGVVAHEADGTFYEHLGRLAGLPAAEVRDRYWAERPSYDLGQDAATYWTRVIDRPLDRRLLEDLVRADVDAWTRFDPAVVKILQAMAASGQRIAMLSNLPAELAAAVKRAPFADVFERMFFSCDTGVAKPDPLAFHLAINQCGVQAQDVVFFDDRLENVAAASFAGLNALTYVSPVQLHDRMGRWLAGRRVLSDFFRRRATAVGVA